MNTKNTAPGDLVAALKVFKAAAKNLERVWEMYPEHAAALGESYGLPLSFEEFAAAVAGWELPTPSN